MTNKTNIEEDIEYLEQFIGKKKEYKYKPIKTKTMINTRQAIENILADRERLEKEKMELKEKINKKDKTIETMRFIKNTSKYEDTILIDEDITTARKNRYLIELKNGEFIEANMLKAKANNYDSLVEKIKEAIEKLDKDGYWDFYETVDLEKAKGILQELLDTEK